MYPIHARQIKAARAILNWSQQDLAQSTGLSITTIRKLEMGFISPRNTTTNVIRQAIEGAGIEFLDSEGVRRRLDDVVIHRGANSCDLFFHDLIQTVSLNNGEVLALFHSESMLAQCGGVTGRYNFKRLEQLQQTAHVKCLVSQAAESPLLPSLFQLRTDLKNSFISTSYFVYGNIYAIVQQESDRAFSFVVYKSAHIAQRYRNYFHERWDDSAPSSAQASLMGRAYA